MIKLLSVAILAGFCFASNRAVPPQPPGPGCWTGWFDRDNPTDTGDFELLRDLRRENPGEICATPRRIEAVTTDTNTPASETGDIIYISSPYIGFVCHNSQQNSGMCRDYKVHFWCSCPGEPDFPV